MIDLTIVIASHDTRDLLLACLASVEAAQVAHPELSVETIVVDNGSSDGSARAVRENFPETRLLALIRNRGFASAMNRGMRAARGRGTLLLNSDVEIGPDLLAHGLGVLDQHAEVGIVGPRLLHPDGRPQRSAHRLPGWRSEFWPFERGHRRSDADRKGDLLLDVEALRGAVLFLRTSMFEKVGVLDESFFFFLEETQYCARVTRAGFRVVLATRLEARHRLGASSKRRAPLATRIEFHRSLYRYLALEHGPWMARSARAARTLRGALLLAILLPVQPFSAQARSRFAERSGLLLWHLRGCPETPGFAQSLEALQSTRQPESIGNEPSTSGGTYPRNGRNICEAAEG